MPPDMSVSLRRTKLKAEEAAIIAGEVVKPSWESRNEGIHERVNFDDSIWGFDLAGGAYYRTPLRVTYVKPDSRAEKAGIRPGDRLLKINGIDTSTLTIQEAHDMIVKSGIHLSLTVTAPEDEVDAVYYYEDPLEEYLAEQERLRLEAEKAKKRQIRAKVNHNWSLQWPWVSKRRIIWRESNCYMVPSKYEEKHRDKFPPQPMTRYSDDIVLYSARDTSKDKVRGQKMPVQRRESQNFEMNSTKDKIENTDEKHKFIESNDDDGEVTENDVENEEEIEENNSIVEEEIENNGVESSNSDFKESDISEENRHSISEDENELSNEDIVLETKQENNLGESNNEYKQFDGITEGDNKKNTEVSDFDDLLNNEENTEFTESEAVDNVLNNNNEIKEDENNNVESIVGSGENSSEKKLE